MKDKTLELLTEVFSLINSDELTRKIARLVNEAYIDGFEFGRKTMREEIIPKLEKLQRRLYEGNQN